MPLSPSQRVKIIREIGVRLGAEEWSLIDLTLREFGLPWKTNWSGTKSDYIMEMVERQDGDKLVSLATHLGYDIGSVPTTYIEPDFWEPGRLRVFLSHLAKHKVWTGELQEALTRYGISSFVAHKDVKPTAKWEEQIELALSTCDAMVALLHDDFHLSKWTDQEIGFAMGRGVPVFSIRLGQDPYGFIGKFQAFQGGDKEPSEVADELFKAYRTNKHTQEKMREILVDLFVKSKNFAAAKEHIGYIEELESWEEKHLDQMERAVESNGQIRKAFGVSERVKKLVEKWGDIPF